MVRGEKTFFKFDVTERDSVAELKKEAFRKAEDALGTKEFSIVYMIQEIAMMQGNVRYSAQCEAYVEELFQPLPPQQPQPYSG
jgi:hypothetical protein